MTTLLDEMRLDEIYHQSTHVLLIIFGDQILNKNIKYKAACEQLATSYDWINQLMD